ncbi:MAG: glycosyl hydrolase [Bacteroidota bacterium]|nr:glycosyl hydrolase [Bacteroidota bacterium]MDP4231370.1 glycosyl hydrolase [Bacteroidota bacterium]
MKYFLLSFLTILWIQPLHAQTKITSATFGMMGARHIGPGTMSGRITSIQGVDEDGKTIYVGTGGGGVWKTTNAGVVFKSVFDKYCQSIGAIAIDQKHPNVVYVGTGESNMRNSVSIGDGMYKSSDGGDNWTNIGLDSTEHIAKILIDPKNSDVIYVAAPGPLWSDSKHRGLYKSIDAGKTWEKILYINEKTGCADIALDPKNPNIVYASTWEFRRLPYSFNSGGPGSGMYKSTDGGKTWNELSNGLPAKPFGRIAFALSPSSPNKLLAIVEAKETGLFISVDGGNSWKHQSATMNVTARPFYFSTIMFDPLDSNRVYRPGFEFAYSNDGGYSFADASGEGGWVHSDHHALWINPKNTNQLYLGTDGGMYISLDKGANWIFVQDLPVGQFYHVATDSQDPYRIYGGLQDNGSWTAPSSAPGGVGNEDWRAINGGDGFWVQPDPTDSMIAYAESQGGEINRINLRTNKSIGVKPQGGPDEEKLRWNWNTPIVTGVANRKNLYIGAQYLYRSDDQGRNWKKISPDLTTNDKKKQEQDSSGGLSADNTSAENHCTIFTMTESPLDANVIWVGTDDGNLQLTTNAGKTWTNLSKNVARSGIASQSWVSSIEPSRFDKNLVYATFDNHMYGDMQTYLGKSTDMGKTWQMIVSPEFTGFAHKIKEDLANRDLLFLGTERGLFATIDGGSNWFRMKNNIPWYALVRDIQIQPTTNDLLLATHGRGIISIDNITPMRALTKDIIEKDVYLFPMPAIALSEGKFGGGGFPSTGGWNGGNSSSSYNPPIEYYLKDRLNTSDANLEIYDSSGKLMQSIPASKRKGINKVYWNLRMKPPKVASGGTKLDFGAMFLAPMVLPGTYTAKLKIGEKEYTNLLLLVHDASNKQFSFEDRMLQYKSAMQLYNLHEQLARTVDDINASQKLIKDNLDSVKDPKSKKILEEYNTKLEDLRTTLLASKQKSIFADEKKLREEITEVYDAVAGQEARPSNLQLERIPVLTERVNKAETEKNEIIGKYSESVKGILAKRSN